MNFHPTNDNRRDPFDVLCDMVAGEMAAPEPPQTRRPKGRVTQSSFDFEFEEVPLFVTEAGAAAGLVDGACVVTPDAYGWGWEITDIVLLVNRPGDREQSRVPVPMDDDPAFWARLSDAITERCGARIDDEVEERRGSWP